VEPFAHNAIKAGFDGVETNVNACFMCIKKMGRLLLRKRGGVTKRIAERVEEPDIPQDHCAYQPMEGSTLGRLKDLPVICMIP